MNKIIPHRWYDDQAEEAATFYVIGQAMTMQSVGLASCRRKPASSRRAVCRCSPTLDSGFRRSDGLNLKRQ